MEELLKRIFLDKKISIYIFTTSFFINLFGLAMPLFVILLINKYVASGLDGTLYTLTVGMIIVITLEALLKKTRNQLTSLIAPIEDNKLSAKLFKTITNTQKLAFEQFSQSLKEELLRGLDIVKNAYNYKNLNAMIDVPFSFLFIIIIFLLSPTIAFFIIVFIGLIVMLIYKASKTNIKQRGLLLAANSVQSAIATSSINSADTVRMYNGSKYINKLWKTQNDGIAKIKENIESKQDNNNILIQFIIICVGVVVYFIGAQEVVAGDLNIGALIGLSILSTKAIAPFVQAVQIFEQINMAKVSLGQINKFTKIQKESEQGTALKQFRGDIELKNVSFFYPGVAKPIFENLNFKLESGKLLMVYGPNGIGKSTFSKLIAGLYKPTKGSMLIDGIDMNQIAPYWWRNQVMYLSQEPSFVQGSILDNLKLLNSEISDEEIDTIITLANLKPFLNSSEKGLLTPLDENGKNLSAGIRHRIAIAMSLVSDGQLVLFDEPTESLDMDGKNTIYTLINQFKEQKKTGIIFTHDRYLLGLADYYIDLSNHINPVMISKEQWIQHYNKANNNEK